MSLVSKFKTPTLMRSRKGALSMDDKPKQPSPRQAKRKAIEALDTSSIVNPSTKKRSASTHDRAQKTRMRTSSPHVEEGAENVKPSFYRTPATKRMASYTGLTEKETTIVYAPDMEARGVTRKNIPWDTFRSTYLCDFSIKAQPKLTLESVKKIGKGNWEEKLFWGRLRRTLSDEVRCSGCAFICLSVLC
jgi:hypothetical protein